MSTDASSLARPVPHRHRRTGRHEEVARGWLVALGLAALLLIGAGAALGPLPGLAAVGAVGVGIVVLRRPIVGAYILVAGAPALSGLQRGLPVPGFRLSEVMIVGVAIVVLVTARRTPRWGAFDWAAFGYVVANAGLVWFNVVRHGDPFTGEELGTLLGPLQFFLLYRTILTAVGDGPQRAFALRLVLLASIPVALLTLLQQWNVAGVRELLFTLTGPDAAQAYTGTVGDIARATGPFPHWHNLGGYLLLVLLLGVSLLHERDQRVLRRPVLLAVLAPAFVALVQTVSLAPLIGLLVGAVLIATYVGQARKTLVWLGVFAIVATVAFGSLFEQRIEQQYQASSATESQTLLPQTIAFRVQVWTTQFVPVIKENPIVGYGPNLPPRLFFDYAESLYVTLLLRGGIVLLLAYLVLMLTLALRARRTARTDDVERRTVGRAVFAAVILLMVIDTIATYFLDSGPAPLLWTLAGLMGAEAVRSARTRERREAE